MMNVIINADDYGVGENQTLAILEAFRRGLCTQTTAMSNMPYFPTAMDLAKKEGVIDKVGLHFCLTQGEPLSDEMRNCRVFCDENGCFTGDFHRSLKTRLFLPSSAKRAIAAEARAQIGRFFDCGGVMMHLDSHHHVHTDGSVAATLLSIARSYGFKTVRMSMTISNQHMSLFKRVYKFAYNAYARRILDFQADDMTNLATYKVIHADYPADKTIEIMVHPVTVNDKLTDLGNEDYTIPA